MIPSKGIIAHTAKELPEGIELNTCYAGIENKVIVTEFRQVSMFLTQDYPNSLHIVWDLTQFTKTLFKLLPPEEQMELDDKTTVFYGDTKIFCVDHLLGLTGQYPVIGNICELREANIYQLRHWLLDGTPEPETIQELEKLGEDIILALDEMGLSPHKLTSPVALYCDLVLDSEAMPTIYNSPEEQIQAMEYCQNMMRYEWRSAYQVGYFDKVYCYDQNSAYPNIIASLPDTNKASVQYSESYIQSHWGIMKGTVEITAPISPIIYDTGDGYINPAGKWETYLTTKEAIWLRNNRVGDFKIKDGYFFTFPNGAIGAMPYRDGVLTLLELKQHYNLVIATIAKKISQGLSGKLDEDHKDGKTGDFYNPILAAITRSQCRLKVGDFIYGYNVGSDLIAVVVDSCVTTREINFVGQEWKLESESPALVLGKGEIWRPDKKPLGLTFNQVIYAINDNPVKSYYEFDNGRYVDLLSAKLDVDRMYDNYPQTGREALGSISQSKPVEVNSGN